MPKSKKPKRAVKPLSEAEKQLLKECEAKIQHACETDPEVLVFLSLGDPALRKIPKLPPAAVARLREFVAGSKARNQSGWYGIEFISMPPESESFLKEKHHELMCRWPKADQWQLARALVDLIAA